MKETLRDSLTDRYLICRQARDCEHQQLSRGALPAHLQPHVDGAQQGAPLRGPAALQETGKKDVACLGIDHTLKH